MGSYDRSLMLSSEEKQDLEWWINNLPKQNGHNLVRTSLNVYRNRNGCIPKRLGDLLRGHSDRRLLEQVRSSPAHQCIRDVGCLLWSQDLCPLQVTRTHSPPFGQCNSDHLCTPPRRDTVKAVCSVSARNSSKGMEPLFISVFPQEENLCPVKSPEEYEKRTQSWRSENSQLHLAIIAPHKPVTSSSIASGHGLRIFWKVAELIFHYSLLTQPEVHQHQ